MSHGAVDVAKSKRNRKPESKAVNSCNFSETVLLYKSYAMDL